MLYHIYMIFLLDCTTHASFVTILIQIIMSFKSLTHTVHNLWPLSSPVPLKAADCSALDRFRKLVPFPTIWLTQSSVGGCLHLSNETRPIISSVVPIYSINSNLALVIPFVSPSVPAQQNLHSSCGFIVLSEDIARSTRSRETLG